MNEKTAAALDLLNQLADQVPLTGPQRRQIDAALVYLREITAPPAPPAPPAPAPRDE